MARIFITGSTDGLGRAAASELIGKGHAVIFHARSAERAGVVADLAARSGGVVIGDLASATETRKIADRVNGSGAVDAIIHNAGIYDQPGRDATPEGHARTLVLRSTIWIGQKGAGTRAKPIPKASSISRRWPSQLPAAGEMF